jgi:NADH-quinone oxidoreductase subunit M
MNQTSVEGSILQMVNHGLSTGALFLLVGVVYERRHTRQISEYGGLSKVMPVYATIFMIMTMSSIGLPTLNGFIGEFLILLGAFHVWPWLTAVGATGVILSAVYMLWMFQRVNYGPMTNAKNRGLRDLSLREWVVIAPICAMAIVMGVVPGAFLRPMEPAVRKTVQAIVGAQVPANTAARPPAPAHRASGSERGLATGAQLGGVVSTGAEMREGASRESGGNAPGSMWRTR